MQKVKTSFTATTIAVTPVGPNSEVMAHQFPPRAENAEPAEGNRREQTTVDFCID